MTDNYNDKPLRQTYWRRVKYNNDSVESYPWELKFIAGKGLAAFSTRNFKAGDWICTEFPTVWISGHHPFTKDQILEIENKVSNLSIEDQVAFYEKENVFSDDAEKIGFWFTFSNCSVIFIFINNRWSYCCGRHFHD